jgi:hypothetical protein
LKLLESAASMKLSRAEMRNKKIFCVVDLIGTRVQYIGTWGTKLFRPGKTVCTY